MPFDAVTIVAAVLFVVVIVFLLKGFTVVPVGEVGIKFRFKARTGQVVGEGTYWLLPFFEEFAYLDPRERQIDIPSHAYPTRDRAKLEFKTTCRIRVADPSALLAQGPGTFMPFLRRGKADIDHGAEERNLPLTKAVENSIREAVQSMSMQDVMYGGQGTMGLRERIRSAVQRTTARWGIETIEVWLTDVSAPELEVEAQRRIKQQLANEADLERFSGEVGRGAMFQRVALEMVEDLRARGVTADVGDVMRYLHAHHQDEKALELARLRGGKEQMAQDMVAVLGGGLLGGGGMVINSQRPAGGGAGRLPGAGAAVPAITQACPSCGAANPDGGAFCDRCGAPTTGAARALPGPSGPTRALPGPTRGAAGGGAWIVGREGDIVQFGDGVSRQHIQIEAQSGYLTVVDLASANGTFLNGQQLAPNAPTPVQAHDTIWLGREVPVRVRDLLAQVGYPV